MNLDVAGASWEPWSEVKFRFLGSPRSVLHMAEVNSQVPLPLGPTLFFSLPSGKDYLGSKPSTGNKN